ncbi:hypothetical protein HK405_003395 [Cladochytrium tenue]|nr:hypothetical protein HK405_003395 [Cladochytrium tenue]
MRSLPSAAPLSSLLLLLLYLAVEGASGARFIGAIVRQAELDVQYVGADTAGAAGAGSPVAGNAGMAPATAGRGSVSAFGRIGRIGGAFASMGAAARQKIGGKGGAVGAAIPGGKTAMLVIDVQKCFLPEGSLAVPHSDEILGPITQLFSNCPGIDYIATSQDSHPPGHISFGPKQPSGIQYLTKDVDKLPPFSNFTYKVGRFGSTYEQVKWPEHCVFDGQHDLLGAEFDPQIDLAIQAWQKDHPCKPKPEGCPYRNFRKGLDPLVDSYSAFHGNKPIKTGFGKTPETGLKEWIRAKNVKNVVVVGLATDYCVGSSAVDAKELLGRDSYVVVVEDASRPVAKESLARMKIKWARVGVEQTTKDELLASSLCKPAAAGGSGMGFAAVNTGTIPLARGRL